MSKSGYAGGCARKTGLRARGRSTSLPKYLCEELGLAKLAPRAHDLPWAKTWVFVREPDAGKPQVLFDERDVETLAMAKLTGHRQPKMAKKENLKLMSPQYILTLPSEIGLGPLKIISIDDSRTIPLT